MCYMYNIMTMIDITTFTTLSMKSINTRACIIGYKVITRAPIVARRIAAL